MRKLNGANSAMLARITGRPIATEARPLTSSFDLVKKSGRGGSGSAGSVILLGQGRDPLCTKLLLLVQHAMGLSGDLLMDAPPHNCIDELRHIANDRCKWKALARSLN